MTPERDLYEVLQVHHSAEPGMIEAAYRLLAKKYHPDVNSDPAAAQYMKEINLAYELLKDSVKRAQYDRLRKGQSDSFGQKRQEQTRSGTPRPPNAARQAHGQKRQEQTRSGTPHPPNAARQAHQKVEIEKHCFTCTLAGIKVPSLIITVSILNDLISIIHFSGDIWFTIFFLGLMPMSILRFIPYKWVSLGWLNHPEMMGRTGLGSDYDHVTRHKCFLGKRVSVFDWLSTVINGFMAICMGAALFHGFWTVVLLLLG